MIKIEKLQFFPIWQEIKSYSMSFFRKDITAAISVALLTLPQSISYALIADLPPSLGVFSAIFGIIICGAFGSSTHLISGPTNAIAILLQSAISDILYTYYRGVTGLEREILATNIAIQISFIAGMLQLLSAFLQLGHLTQFVSRSVIVGYSVGVSIAIWAGQIFYLTGIAPDKDAITIHDMLFSFFTRIQTINWVTAGLGIASLLFLWLLKRKFPKFPAAVTMLILASFGAYFLDFKAQVHVPLIADFASGGGVWPTFSFVWMDWRVLNTLLPAAFAIALIGILEATSISRSLSVQTGQHVVIDQEIFSLGIGNTASALFGGMPISGSFSRSALCFASRGKTRLVSVFTGVLIAIFGIAFYSTISWIPLTCLAALLIFTAFNLVDLKQITLCLRTTGSDAFVLFVTIFSCLSFNLDTAFYVGIVISIILFLRKAAKPSFSEYSVTDTGSLKIVNSAKDRTHPELRLIHIEGELFFGAADIFQKALQEVADDKNIRVVILRLKNAHHLDATTCLAIQQLHSYLKKTGRHLLICGITRPLLLVLRNSGLSKQIGEENIFIQNQMNPNNSTVQAFNLALKLVGKS